jgi:hypothetical protein
MSEISIMSEISKDGLLARMAPSDAVQFLLQIFDKQEITRDDLFSLLGLDPKMKSNMYCLTAEEYKWLKSERARQCADG